MRPRVYSEKLLGENLQRQRAAQDGGRGWTPDQLEARSGVDRTYIGRLERGKAVPRLDIVLKLMWALNCSLEKLLEVRPVVQRLTDKEECEALWRRGAKAMTLKEATDAARE